MLLVGVVCESHGSSLSDAGICDTVASRDGSARLGVLSAFPAELRPLAEALEMRERVEIPPPVHTELAACVVLPDEHRHAERRFDHQLAEPDGRPSVWRRRRQPHRIGDVTVPLQFRYGRRHHRQRALLVALARKLKTVKLERVPTCPRPSSTCVPALPSRIFVGGLGESGSLRRLSVTMRPTTILFGCDVGPLSGVAARSSRCPTRRRTWRCRGARGAEPRHSVEAALRAVSDGAVIRSVPRVPAQFFAYYVPAAHNAAQGAMKSRGAGSWERPRPLALCRLGPANQLLHAAVASAARTSPSRCGTGSRCPPLRKAADRVTRPLPTASRVRVARIQTSSSKSSDESPKRTKRTSGAGSASTNSTRPAVLSTRVTHVRRRRHAHRDGHASVDAGDQLTRPDTNSEFGTIRCCRATISVERMLIACDPPSVSPTVAVVTDRDRPPDKGRMMPEMKRGDVLKPEADADAQDAGDHGQPCQIDAQIFSPTTSRVK
jgi:hypothetical protein